MARRRGCRRRCAARNFTSIIFSRNGALGFNATSVDDMFVSRKSRVGGSGIGKSNKSESSRSARTRVAHDHGVGHYSKFLEKGAKFFCHSKYMEVAENKCER